MMGEGRDRAKGSTSKLNTQNSHTPSPKPMSYNRALQLITEATETVAIELDLSGLVLTELSPEIGQLTDLS